MIRGKQNQVVGVFGHKGHGKSRWVKRQLRKLPGELMVWDPMGEYHRDGPRASDPIPSAKRFAWDPDRGWFGFRDFLESVRRTGRVGRAVIEGPEDAFEPFCRMAYRYGDRDRPLTVVLEEVDQHTSPNRTPQHLRELLARGRHKGIDLMAVSRFPVEVSRHLTRALDRWVIFRIQEARDLQFFAQRFDRALADRLPKLRQGQYLERA